MIADRGEKERERDVHGRDRKVALVMTLAQLL